MPKTVEVDLDQVRRLFDFLESVHDLFHQPLKYKDATVVEQFAAAHYQELRELYYDIVWNRLPSDTQREVEER